MALLKIKYAMQRFEITTGETRNPIDQTTEWSHLEKPLPIDHSSFGQVIFNRSPS
jgi:hypothetical protein